MQKKKSLGQHFLRAKTYLAAVADAAEVSPDEYVLEIGPGDGSLTEELVSRGAHVVAIEKDYRLIPILKEKFAGKDLEVIEGDALKLEMPRYANKAYKVVGNIPYYITGALLKKFLSAENQPSTLVFLVQKEVAERIARGKKESILSLSIKAYGTPRYVRTVPAGAFVPPPKVDSSILAVSDISRSAFKNKAHEEQFFKLLHAGFNAKRKFLRRNLESILGNNTEILFKNLAIPQNARAEDVPLEQWLALAKN